MGDDRPTALVSGYINASNDSIRSDLSILALTETGRQREQPNALVIAYRASRSCRTVRNREGERSRLANRGLAFPKD